MASDIGTGTTITASGSNATWAALVEVLNIDFSDLWQREAINFSHMETTGAHVFKPTDLYDPGSITVSVQFDPAAVIVPAAAAENWTVTFPGGETFICSGFITSYGKGIPMEEKMTQTFTIKLTGAISGTVIA